MAIGPCAQVPPDYGETGIGVAVGNSFVEVGIADSGSGAEAVVGGDGLVVGVGVVDSGSGVEAVVGSGALVMGVGAVVSGVAWATGSWVAAGALGVSACRLHPHRNKPASALAAAIWIFCIDFIFVMPLFA